MNFVGYRGKMFYLSTKSILFIDFKWKEGLFSRPAGFSGAFFFVKNKLILKFN